MAARRDNQGNRLRWSIGATGVALILWGVISLSDTYVWRIDVPLEVRIDTTNEALAEPIPQTLRVEAYGDGWTLMQMILDDDIVCRIDLPTGASMREEVLPGDSLRFYRYDQRDLEARINTPSSIQIRSIRPGSLRLVVTDLARKRVPLFYDQSYTFNTREGFQIIGRPSVYPDSVTLSGSPEALDQISFWRTEPLPLEELYEPIQVPVPVDDTLHGVVLVVPETATVAVNVQEVAELRLESLLVINRGTRTDTTLSLRLYPDRVTVTLRGGAGELGRLREGDVIPYVNLTPGIDTTGFTTPRIILPPFSNATVISIEPDRIRYVWRRSIEGRGAVGSVATGGG